MPVSPPPLPDENTPRCIDGESLFAYALVAGQFGVHRYLSGYRFRGILYALGTLTGALFLVRWIYLLPFFLVLVLTLADIRDIARGCYTNASGTLRYQGKPWMFGAAVLALVVLPALTIAMVVWFWKVFGDALLEQVYRLLAG